MRRGLIALVLVAAACSGSSGPTSTSTSTSTSEPPATGPVTEPPPPSEAPDLPDPDDLARGPLEEVDGQSAEPDLQLEQSARARLALVINSFVDGVAVEWFEDGGEPILVFSLYPAGDARGDPAFAEGVASFIAEPLDPEAVEIAGLPGQRALLDGHWWHLWSSNTHLFITVGVGEDAPGVLEELVASNQDLYLWQAGDCLHLQGALPYAPFGGANVVPCDSGHEWEVVAGEAIDDSGDAAFPGQSLSDRSLGLCEEAVANYIGLFPNDTSLIVVRYLPDAAEWAEGDRYLACAIAQRDEDGLARLRQGSLAGASAAVRADRTPEDCLQAIDAEVRDCARAHAFQYVGLATVDPDPGPYPGGEATTELLEAACRVEIDSFTGPRLRPPADLEPVVMELGPHAWDQGVRAAPCFAIAVDGAGGLLEVRGSFAEEWQPIGAAGEGITV